MKAAFIRQVGPAENISYGDLPIPAAEARQVLVKVSAVTVDPVDTYIRSGKFPLKLPLPFVIGRDAVGVVTWVGRDVTRFSPGDHVWCNNQGYAGRQGTFSEFISVDEALLYALPPGVADREAVAFVHGALTAQLGLKRAAARDGQSIFVNGGSGAVGSAVLQFAKAAGLRTIATAGDADGLGWCQTAGADRAVNYKTDDVDAAIAEFAPGGVDVYWDTSGKPDFNQAISRSAHGGRVIVMAGMAAQPPFPVGQFYTKECTAIGFAITYASEIDLQQAADQINAWMAQGRHRIRIDRVMPLSEAAAAHRLFDDHVRLSGKVVLIP